MTTIGGSPEGVASDGSDVWAVNASSNSVSRVRGSDGRLLETWTGATSGIVALVAMGRVFVDSSEVPGKLYRIDPSQPAGAVTTVVTNLGNVPRGLTFDGSRIWSANTGSGNTGRSVSIVTPGATIPWTVTTVTTGFSFPAGAVFDGANVWVTDAIPGTLLKLDAAGAIAQTVFVGSGPELPVFDGSNIWVPNNSSASVTVVRASTGVVLQTLTGNGMNAPFAAAFDGQRVLVTNGGNSSVSLWKAADLSPLGSVALGGSDPFGACSDGLNFWITLESPGTLLRF